MTNCYHCGDDCITLIIEGDKNFCCQGCRQVYLLLNENNLCSYYNFDKNPGIKVKGKFASERFAYLEDESVIEKLISFRSDTQTNVTFSLPQMHCSSCIFLLENLHRINEGIISSQTNFQRKEVFISFNEKMISLRKVVELLAFIGYEPFISLNDSKEKKGIKFDRKQLYKIGIAGFCFSNIMMLSFPEYFSHGAIDEQGLKQTFSWLIFGLSLPVLFYSASAIFKSAFKGLQQKNINIDVPLALAIVITFVRSYYEIISGTGAGYLDSGTGIIFFILIGRWFQNKTYDALTFDRDYHSYFPLGVTVLKKGKEENIPATKLEMGDYIIIKNEEMVPADSLLTEGSAYIDYSFVSGENNPVPINKGEIIYAGGKQIGTSLQLQVIKKPSQSYITQLWNNEIFGQTKNAATSFIHPWSRYFTGALFLVAFCAAAFWYFHDPSKIWPVVTAVLIVACPCSLLLSATFTFGNMVRIFGKNQLYLKNANVIETLAGIDTIVFDKTGTLTETNLGDLHYTGIDLSITDKSFIKKVTAQSSHTLSKLINSSFVTNEIEQELPEINSFEEHAGKGIAAIINQVPIKVGAANFLDEKMHVSANNGSRVYVMIDHATKGFFEIKNKYRPGIKDLVNDLKKANYELHVVSGDNAAEKERLEQIFTSTTTLNFNTSPQKKLDYIKRLQAEGKKVLMIGDGLNDAGALMQSDAGIAVSNNAARFTPACDAIIDGDAVQKTAQFMDFAKAGKKVVGAGFALSILYNVVGLSFAVQGRLDPVVAAVLMPASSISIVGLASLLSSFIGKRKKL
ncbi:MAG: heavy metal translocating P-type ATPase metal-binding domain-containing protein [Bacteroidota bacterium]|nr:heavy metal translocating P-type ATPase metal-binding domain-containing protein [Bacteroidota bacterium]